MDSYPPQSPAEISVFSENGRYVFRVGESRAIYTYDLDTRGRSNCTGVCTASWPPVVADDEAHSVGAWSIVTRPDHSKQWAYKNRPIYTYSHDAPGKALGDGLDGVWHIVVA